MKINVAGIVRDSAVDGPGLRLAVFTQGCPHACPGCHNPDTWSFEGGVEKDCAVLAALALEDPLCAGVTITGGEPFMQAKACAHLAKLVREGGKSVWTYTGYTIKELKEAGNPAWDELLEYSNTLVDGPFVLERRTLSKPFVGSDNQCVIRLTED